MIRLITGLPGSAKTLFVVTEIKKMLDKRNADIPGAATYYYGINDLKLDWILIDDPERWYELPVGSAIIIDEAQTVFRPRSNSAKVPLHVSEFETHRHKGFDIFLITQHPGLVDSNIRKLVGEHIHIKRSFGGASSFTYTHQGVNANCSASNSGSERKAWGHDKNGYGLYKSAEIHTHKRKLPRAFYFLLIAPVLIFGLLYFGYTSISSSSVLSDIETTFTDSTENLLGSPGLSASSPGADQYFTDRVPRITQLPHTAPIYDDLTEPVRVPYPAACISSDTGCNCYTSQATPLPVNLSMCRQIVATGFYMDWGDVGTINQDLKEARAPAQPASTPANPVHTYPIDHYPRSSNLGNFSVNY